MTSRTPAPSPCPAKGGIRWAASPASSTRPSRQRVAQPAWKVYAACRSSSALSGVNPWGASSSQALSVRLSSLLALVGQPHELPAPAVGPAGDHRGGPPDVAALRGHVRELQLRSRLDVHDEPVVEVALVVPLDAGPAANRAVGAVSADHPRGGDGELLAGVGGAHSDGGRLVVLGQVVGLPAAGH